MAYQFKIPTAYSALTGEVVAWEQTELRGDDNIETDHENTRSNRKPFAKKAVDGIRGIIEGAGFELALLENIRIRPNCWRPLPMRMR